MTRADHDAALAEWRYGPEWRTVVAVMRESPFGLPLGDGSTAAYRRARRAAFAANRATAWFAVADDAPRAAIVFDLIGQHGYTRADHDALTAPYRAAFGDPWAGR